MGPRESSFKMAPVAQLGRHDRSRRLSLARKLLLVGTTSPIDSDLKQPWLIEAITACTRKLITSGQVPKSG